MIPSCVKKRWEYFFRSTFALDLNICAHTWHAVLVIAHKQGLELAVPAL